MKTTFNKVFFLGIGGIGMSALARYFKAQGAHVSGYDRTPTALTQQLQQEGISIFFEDELALYPNDADLIVFTPAIPSNHIGLNHYKSSHLNLKKRSEVLGLISNNHFTIAVAGSHGKTTVSSMIAHILLHNNYNCTAFLGGICSNYQSNFLHPGKHTTKPLRGMGNESLFVIEADEFDRSFHRLQPNYAVITAVDTDHLDIYGSKEAIDEAFIEFANKIDEEGFLVIKQNQSINNSLPSIDKAFYALQQTDADVFCSKYWVVEGGYLFHLNYFGKEYKSIRLNIGGLHNIENAIAAFTICKELGLNNEEIYAGIASFKGIKRRFEKLVEHERHVFIDDYAHHPEEIRMFLSSLKELYANKKITAIFQPHLFTRTRDLAIGFAESLSIADEVILLDIYPARELPIKGVSSQLIFEKITAKEKHLITKHELVEFIRTKQHIEVLASIGAGDIDKYLPEIAALLA